MMQIWLIASSSAGAAPLPSSHVCCRLFVLTSHCLLAYLGYVLGNHLSTLGPIFRSLDVVIIVAVVLLVALYIWRHIRNDRKARATHAVAEAEARSVNQQMLQSEQPPPEQTQF